MVREEKQETNHIHIHSFHTLLSPFSSPFSVLELRLDPLKLTMTLTLPPPKSPFFKTLFFFLALFPSYLALPDPDAAASASLQPIIPHPSSTSSSTGTIPAFPEQADVEGCPLNLSDEHYEGIKSACGSNKNAADKDLHRSRCCPVLAAWLYSAYSVTALGGGMQHQRASQGHATSYDMPLLPDDSETCVSDLGKALKVRGIHLVQPNETCDVVYCYCGIRLHPLTCTESFSITPSGSLVVDGSVRRLERDCLSSSTNVNKFPGLGGCSKCLHSLYSVSFQLLPSYFVLFTVLVLALFVSDVPWIDLTSLNMMKLIKVSYQLTLLSSSFSMIGKVFFFFCLPLLRILVSVV